LHPQKIIVKKKKKNSATLYFCQLLRLFLRFYRQNLRFQSKLFLILSSDLVVFTFSDPKPLTGHFLSQQKNHFFPPHPVDFTVFSCRIAPTRPQ
jgi:hypothetical protein